jgi:hypothetical protein
MAARLTSAYARQCGALQRVPRVRLDGGFLDPLLLTFLDARGVECVVAMASHAVVNRWAEPQME